MEITYARYPKQLLDILPRHREVRGRRLPAFVALAPNYEVWPGCSEQPGKLLLSEPQVPANGQNIRVINAE